MVNRDDEERGAKELRVPGEGYPGSGLIEERNRQRYRLSEELRRLDREIKASEGYGVSERLGLLEKSYLVFEGNRSNLMHLLREFGQPVVFVKLWEGRRQGRFDLFANELVRLFHNYVAGTVTLLEHVRALRDDGDERPEEEHQVEGASLPRFMEDLLTYMLREGLPFALAELSFGGMGGGVEVESAVALDVERLRGWERWSERGREYLGGLSGKTQLSALVDEHASLVSDLYRRFATRQAGTHEEAFGKLLELRTKRVNLVREIEELEDVLESAERTAVALREEREGLERKLEAERQYRSWEKSRADAFEQSLERERSRGFWSRLFGS